MPDVIAKHGDVVATTGTALPPGAASGTWTAGPVVYPGKYAKFTINGSCVIYKATCTFTFNGFTPPPANAPMVVPSPVTLKASTTAKIQHGQNNVLKAGDSKQDSYGNTLAVGNINLDTNKIQTE